MAESNNQYKHIQTKQTTKITLIALFASSNKSLTKKKTNLRLAFLLPPAPHSKIHFTYLTSASTQPDKQTYRHSMCFNPLHNTRTWLLSKLLLAHIYYQEPKAA